MPRSVFTVSSLNREVRGLLEASYPEVWVEGEVSGLSAPASGHLYFHLKDETSRIRCALFKNRLFRLAYRPQEGRLILARGRLSLYEDRGDYQFLIDYAEAAGEGELRRRFEALKHRLSLEGLFSADLKRSIPSVPTCIGIVTSPTGAALHDVLVTLKRRLPSCPVIVYPTSVQGAAATGEIVAALERANSDNRCDVLILARGGGSLEDLWSFNEESVARAVRDSALPVVTGIGHEVDITIADFAADLRAATPTAAAETVTPDYTELLASTFALTKRLLYGIETRLGREGQRIDGFSARLRHPGAELGARRHRLVALETRLHSILKGRFNSWKRDAVALQERLRRRTPAALLNESRFQLIAETSRLTRRVERQLQRRELRLESLDARLRAMSPQRTLERGYAVVRPLGSNQPLTRVTQTAEGNRIDVELADGQLDCTVDRVLPRET